ncbi:MAG: alpha/beta hydrolase [Christensenellales bacterium]|jgi:putative tributyrin esterase
MALIHMNYFSQILHSNTDVNVIIPTPNTMDEPINPGNYFHEGARYQVLYLLHGTHGDYSDWTRMTSIEKYAQRAKLMVVMPSFANSFYQNFRPGYGYRYFDLLTDELPTYIRTLFPASARREDTFIGGLSMGAYGAFNAAIRRPDMYSAAIALSGGLDFIPLIDLEQEDAQWPWRAMLDAPHTGVDTDLDDAPLLKKKVEEDGRLPRFYMAIGTEDFLYDNVQENRRFMQELGVELTYEEGPGGHTWDFWDEYIQRAIKWLNVKGTTV